MRIVNSDTRPTPSSHRVQGISRWEEKWIVNDEWEIAYLIATLCTLPLTVQPERKYTLELNVTEHMILRSALSYYRHRQASYPGSLTEQYITSMLARLREMW